MGTTWRASTCTGFGAHATVLDRPPAFGYTFAPPLGLREEDQDQMPNIRSAEKRMRLSRAANKRNRASRSRLRTAIKRLRQAEDAPSAQSAYKQVQVLLDRAATKRLMHPNAVARMKSKLARQANEPV